MTENSLHPRHIRQFIVIKGLIPVLIRSGTASHLRRNGPKTSFFTVQLRVDVLGGGFFAGQKLSEKRGLRVQVYLLEVVCEVFLVAACWFVTRLSL